MATAPIIKDRSDGAAILVVIVNFRTPDLTIECLDALAPQAADERAIAIIVDGGSADGSAAHIAAALGARGDDPWVRLLPLPLNGGFGYANNQAILDQAGARLPPYICLLNPDARVRKGALHDLRSVLDRMPRCGAVGALLEEEDGAPQGSAFVFPSILREFCRGASTDFLRRLLRQPEPVVRCNAACPVDWVTGALVMFRTQALVDAGLFDDGFFLYFEEVELMHRLRTAGWQVWHEPAARTVHQGGASTDIRFGADGFHKRAALPRYWYDSRRRYFARTGGAAHALFAGLAYTAGRTIWAVRRRLQRRADTAPLRSTRDILRFSTIVRSRDRVERIPRIGDPPGRLPAWMDLDGGPAEGGRG